MPLRHEPDVAVADWFARRDEPWQRLCMLGPSVFPAYVRVSDQSLDWPGLLAPVLARHTATPEDCLFGLWDGFGDIHGSPAVSLMVSTVGGETAGATPHVPPAFPPAVMAAPRVQIPARSYLLFRGPLAMAGEWGAADLAPGWPRTLHPPNLAWPTDRAWFVASEIDQEWTGVGGSQALVAVLLATPSLDVELVSPAD